MLGVQMSIMSISGSLNNASGSVCSLVTPFSAPKRFSASSLISLPATSSASLEASQPGRCVRAIPPTPTIPTLSVLMAYPCFWLWFDLREM